MTFLQSADPLYKRIYIDFNNYSSGTLPSDWSTRIARGSAGPEIYSSYMRSASTETFNQSSQSYAIHVGDKVNTDDQIVRATTRTGLTALYSGILLKVDSTLTYGVLAIMTTSSNAGIYTLNAGTLTKRANVTGSGHSTGDIWALRADGDTYTLLRDPNHDNTGGTVRSTWTDTTEVVNHGPFYRYGGFFFNSDRNAIGTQNRSAGLDNFDFRDLGWTD